MPAKIKIILEWILPNYILEKRNEVKLEKQILPDNLELISTLKEDENKIKRKSSPHLVMNADGKILKK
jgi:hypothetical protein